MTGQQRNSNRKANGKWWRFQNSLCGRGEVSTTPSDTLFFASLFRRRFCESVKPSDSYPETPTSSTPPTTSTSSSSSSTFASVPVSVSHTPPTSFGPSGPPTGLSSPLSLSSNLFFGDIKSGRGNSRLNSWLTVPLRRTNLLEQDEAFFIHTSEFNSKNVANKLFHGGLISSFMKIIFVLVHNMTDLSASIDVIIIIFSKIHWGRNFKIPHF